MADRVRFGDGTYGDPNAEAGVTYPASWKDENAPTGHSVFSPSGYDTSGNSSPIPVWGGMDAYRQRMEQKGGAELAHAQGLVNDKRYMGRYQMRQGMAEAQNAALGMAAGRGSNPLAQRSAQYANAQMSANAVNQGAQLALQEYMARQAMLGQALARQTGYEQMMQDDASRRYLGQLQYQASMQGQKTQADIAEADREMQLIGAAVGAGGSLIGAMSDESQKTILSSNDAQITPYGYLAPPGTNPYGVTAYGYYERPADPDIRAPGDGTEVSKVSDSKSTGGMGRASAANVTSHYKELGTGKNDNSARFNPNVNSGAVNDSGTGNAQNLIAQLEAEGRKTNAQLMAPPPRSPGYEPPPMAARPGIVREFPDGNPYERPSVDPSPRATRYGFLGPAGSWEAPRSTEELARRGLGASFYGAYAPAGTYDFIRQGQASQPQPGDAQVAALSAQLDAEDARMQQQLGLSDKRAKELLSENRELKGRLRNMAERSELGNVTVPASTRGIWATGAQAQVDSIHNGMNPMARGARASREHIGAATGERPYMPTWTTLEQAEPPVRAFDAVIGQRLSRAEGDPEEDPIQQGSLGDVDRANIATMRGINPEMWRYKAGAQRALGLTPRVQVGPTAQNLEATPLGSTVVYDTPAGKQIDVKGATMQLLGQTGTLQRQVDTTASRLASLEDAIYGKRRA